MDFRRQNLTSMDVRFWRLKSIPALKGLFYRYTWNTKNIHAHKFSSPVSNLVLQVVESIYNPLVGRLTAQNMVFTSDHDANVSFGNNVP